MRRALIWLVLVLAAAALPVRWAAAQFKNEGMGVLVPPTRGIPHPGSAPSYDPVPPPPMSVPAPTPAPAPAQSSPNPPAPPPPATGQKAK